MGSLDIGTAGPVSPMKGATVTEVRSLLYPQNIHILWLHQYVVLHSSCSEAVHMQPDHLVVQTVVISVVYICFIIYVHSFRTTVY